MQRRLHHAEPAGRARPNLHIQVWHKPTPACDGVGRAWGLGRSPMEGLVLEFNLDRAVDNPESMRAKPTPGGRCHRRTVGHPKLGAVP